MTGQGQLAQLPALAVQDAESPQRSAFGNALADYLAKLRLPPADAAYAAALVARHDFSSARAALLPSVPGSHSGARPRRLPSGSACVQDTTRFPVAPLLS